MAEASKAGNKKENAVGIKETLSSLIIAFMLAFLFRGFVIEGFLIPTGSMAPTLLGKHVRMQGEESGYNWTVGPWTYADPRTRSVPVKSQQNIQVQDPMSGLVQQDTNRRLAAGDRVFVLKYLPWLHHPSRWDVVVFKNPGTNENYIKRLVGMPGEQLAVVDGDIFARPYVEGQTSESGWDAWAEDGWSVQRKPERVQRTMLQEVFNSHFAPTDPNVIEYQSPLSGEGSGWAGIGSGGTYTFSGTGSAKLAWNDKRPLTDMNAYNQTHGGIDLFAESDNLQIRDAFRPFPDGDLALSLNIKCEQEQAVIHPTVVARGMEFRASVNLAAGTSSVEMRDEESEDSVWTTLDEHSFSAVAAGDWASVEFWHIDQALWLFIDGKLVCGGNEAGAYHLTPAQRASAALGRGWEEMQTFPAGDGVDTLGIFAKSELYRKPTLRWDFEGGGFTLTNVRVQRDIAYQVNTFRPTRGGHPNFFPTLNGEQYFMCGDNSSNSEDSRLWLENSINKWVSQEIDNTPGVVNKDLIVGKAFIVYFPAPLDNGPILTPDVGRVRWIF